RVADKTSAVDHSVARGRELLRRFQLQRIRTGAAIITDDKYRADGAAYSRQLVEPECAVVDRDCAGVRVGNASAHFERAQTDFDQRIVISGELAVDDQRAAVIHADQVR